MKTLDEKRDIILGVMNTPNDKMTVVQLAEAVREIVDIMWPLPDIAPEVIQTVIDTPVVQEELSSVPEALSTTTTVS